MSDIRDTFYWYDLETSGTDPRWDRVVQFAGLRTDGDLNEIGDALVSYVRLPRDVLPDPGACRVTGLTPQRVNAEGTPELEAWCEIAARFMVPRTCVAGFNNLRFDDEFVRYGLFRHFIDPYAREWQGGNSRWDLIDLARAAAALRPEGLVWPEADGLPVFRLEVLTAANGVEHGRAHDALADVRATLALARLIKTHQPRLYHYYLGLRDKGAALAMLRPERPEICLHVSGRLGREQHCIAPVMPLARHPENRSSVIVADLSRPIDALLELDADALAQCLFAPAVARPPGMLPRPGIKEVRANRCPFLAPRSALRAEDARRLGWDRTLIEQRFERLRRTAGLREKLLAVYRAHPAVATPDVDASLYDGFIADADRERCRQLVATLREAGISARTCADPGFEDERLSELLLRLRARADEAGLDAEARRRWRAFARSKLLGDARQPWRTLAAYRDALAREHEIAAGGASRPLLEALHAHGDDIERWLCQE